jgi:flagellar P-ring protein precursor FlgI
MLSQTAVADRLKDLVNVQGARGNHLIGYGLVVGLVGTGDQSSPVTSQTVLNMLQQMGVYLPPGTDPKSKNAAVVMVTAVLGAFAQPGQTLDVTVGAFGTAKNLRGGTLLMTPLKGADGQVYALAQGSLRFDAASISVLSPQYAVDKPIIIPNGATVERAVNASLGENEYILLELKDSSFINAGTVAQTIDFQYGVSTAQAMDGRTIRVRAPMTINERVAFLGELEMLDIPTAPAAPKVVLNARTGSVVINQAVTLDPCAVSHNSINLVINATQGGGPPGAASVGVQAVPQAIGQLIELNQGVLLSDVVRALNAIGASPQDLQIILQSMKAAGSLHAELQII